MKNNKEYIFLSILFMFLFITCGYAQERDIYNLQFKNGTTQKATSFRIEKDEIIFYDLFDLEHLVNKSKISSIIKIKNQTLSLDVIKLVNNTINEGIILKIYPSKNLVLYSLTNDTLLIPIENIKSISKKIIAPKNFQKNKYELGASLGFPSAVNLMAAIWFNDFGLRLSGLYIGIAKGVQFNVCYKISENKKRYHSIALVLGNSDIEKDKFGRIYLKNFHWQYTGIVYDVNISDFWTEIGLSYGLGNYNNPQIIFQIGYSAKLF